MDQTEGRSIEIGWGNPLLTLSPSSLLWSSDNKVASLSLSPLWHCLISFRYHTIQSHNGHQALLSDTAHLRVTSDMDNMDTIQRYTARPPGNMSQKIFKNFIFNNILDSSRYLRSPGSGPDYVWRTPAGQLVSPHRSRGQEEAPVQRVGPQAAKEDVHNYILSCRPFLLNCFIVFGSFNVLCTLWAR